MRGSSFQIQMHFSCHFEHQKSDFILIGSQKQIGLIVLLPSHCSIEEDAEQLLFYCWNNLICSITFSSGVTTSFLFFLSSCTITGVHRLQSVRAHTKHTSSNPQCQGGQTHRIRTDKHILYTNTYMFTGSQQNVVRERHVLSTSRISICCGRQYMLMAPQTKCFAGVRSHGTMRFGVTHFF